MSVARQNPDSAGELSPAHIAILEILIERPRPTSEIARCFAVRYKRVLDVGYSRVRQALRWCQVHGLVELLPPLDAEDFELSGRRVHYRVTAAGAGAYRRWIGAGSTDPSELRQRLLAAHSPTDLLTIIDAYEHACREGIARISRPADATLAEELIANRDREEYMGGLRWAEASRVRILRERSA